MKNLLLYIKQFASRPRAEIILDSCRSFEAMMPMNELYGLHGSHFTLPLRDAKQDIELQSEPQILRAYQP